METCGRAADLLPTVLLQAVEQLVRVGEPEGQQLKVFVVTLKRINVKTTHDLSPNIFIFFDMVQ